MVLIRRTFLGVVATLTSRLLTRTLTTPVKMSTLKKSQVSIAATNSLISDLESSRFPRVECQDDVVKTFFNQIVEFVIKDMVILEPKPIKFEEEDEPELIVKDYKELSSEDLANAEIAAVSGSKVSLRKSQSSDSRTKKSRSSQDSKRNSSTVVSSKNTSGTTSAVSSKNLTGTSSAVSSKNQSSADVKQKRSSRLSVILEEKVTARSKSAISTASSLQDPLMEEEREVKIIFTNANVYEGRIAKRIMNGKGKYTWADGTVYEGDFVDGFPTGRGEMILPDLSKYRGEFNMGLFHGEGFLNYVSTPSFYSGQWKNGKRHGQGWHLYKPGNWYEGGWIDDLKDGFGIRQDLNGAKYRGTWKTGKVHGYGVMLWENNDYYKGGWEDGLIHGKGEYIWNAYYNNTFAFPIQNYYRGSWSEGKRCGKGVMHFGGDSGCRLNGNWDQDFKHGDGYLVCGNGKVIEQSPLFEYDKALFSEQMSAVFTIPEDINVSYYIDKLLEKIKGVSKSKMELLKTFEAQCVKNTIINFLPELNDLYKKYAKMAAKTELKFEPVMVRVFLWQLYRDVGIFDLGLSLVDTDLILAENPLSALDNPHSPFEPIYFWQFLMSLIGVALTTTSLDESFDSPSHGGVSAFIVKKFFEDSIFAKLPPNMQGSLFFTYLDLVPVKRVYAHYQKLGEPHTAKTFLRHCCTKKGEEPVLCHLEINPQKEDPKPGINLVPLVNHIIYKTQSPTKKLEEDLSYKWTNLRDFRILGPKNVVRCLGSVCPLILVDGVVANMNYPLTFLEFYEALLSCIIMVLELDLKREKKILLKSMQPEPPPVPVPSKKQINSKTGVSVKSVDSKKKGKGKKK